MRANVILSRLQSHGKTHADLLRGKPGNWSLQDSLVKNIGSDPEIHALFTLLREPSVLAYTRNAQAQGPALVSAAAKADADILTSAQAAILVRHSSRVACMASDASYRYAVDSDKALEKTIGSKVTELGAV